VRVREGRVLRLFLARPVRLAFDTVIRDEMGPDLRALDGVIAVWIGRQGPDELGDRALISLWESEAAMLAAMGEDIERSRFHPEHLAETVQRRLEVLPVLVEMGTQRATTAAILRIARGRLATIDLATYARDVQAGASRDLERGRGPETLILCADGDDRFVTVSTWADWDALATATGASIDHPVRTREQHAIEGFTAAHLELIRLDG
jgi:hypothetical protein